MKCKKQNWGEAGFTIVELLVSLIVGSILVGAVHIVYTNQLSLSQQQRDTVIANAFIEAKVEAVRSKGYLATPIGTTDISSELPSELSVPRSASMVVSAHTDAVKKVVLNITFNLQGRVQSYSYTTYLGELGVGQY